MSTQSNVTRHGSASRNGPPLTLHREKNSPGGSSQINWRTRLPSSTDLSSSSSSTYNNGDHWTNRKSSKHRFTNAVVTSDVRQSTSSRHRCQSPSPRNGTLNETARSAGNVCSQPPHDGVPQNTVASPPSLPPPVSQNANFFAQRLRVSKIANWGDCDDDDDEDL
jgi:hypothetical protein